jgi:hypothetical protein
VQKSENFLSACDYEDRTAWLEIEEECKDEEDQRDSEEQ